MSSVLTPLDAPGKQLVSSRLSEALGANSHSIEVEIEQAGPESVFAAVASLFNAADDEFIATSQQLANRLSRAQTVGSIKSGIAVIIEATVGPDANPQRTAIIVKAESDAAFIKRTAGGRLTLEYVRDMVFGPQQRLFKIGAFVEIRQPEDAAQPRTAAEFSAVVYDHGLDIKTVHPAAKYFYSGFLGTSMAPSAPALNKVFYLTTAEFIKQSNRTREEKWELKAGLNSYFRSEEATISARAFGDRFLRDDAERASYRRMLHEARFPARAVQKDDRFIRENLRIRRLTFSSRVVISGPADGWNNNVEVVDQTEEAITLKIKGNIVEDQ